MKIPPILLEGDETALLPPAESDPRFALDVPRVAVGIETRSVDLPEAYGTERLWLAARDPHCLYARWDLTSEQQGNYRALAIHGQLLLRLHLEKLKDHGVAEVQLRPNDRHCFIPVAFPGQRYLAELGYYEKNGCWHSIVFSDPVSTPQTGVSKDKTIQFATIANLRALAPQTTSAIAPFSKSAAPQEGQGPEKVEHPRLPNLSQIFKFSNTFIVPPLPAGESADEARSVSAFTSGIPEGSLEFEVTAVPDWSATREEALAEIIGWSAAGFAAPSSAEMGQWVEIESGLGPLGGISSLPVQGQITSPAGSQVPQSENFWFSLNAELVIYGATDPAGRVSIGGRAIQLHPDGTFSYRFALPDGRYELAIEAASKQGDVRRAHLEFFRGTSHQGEVQAHPQDPELKKPDAGNVPEG